jgi:hypothetical protein
VFAVAALVYYLHLVADLLSIFTIKKGIELMLPTQELDIIHKNRLSNWQKLCFYHSNKATIKTI